MKIRQLIIVVVAIVILVLAFVISGMLADAKEDPASKPADQVIRAVSVDTVNYTDVQVTFVAPGRLGSLQYVNVITEVMGELLPTDVPLKKGQSFKKGDQLVHVFDLEFSNNLKASRARFLNLIANALPDFKIDFPDQFDALMGFFESIDINENLPELPEIKSQKVRTFLSSRSILDQYYSIKSLEITYTKYRLFAPFDGAYTDVFQEFGSIASPGSPVARIIRTDKMELEVPVEVDDAIWVSNGDIVKIYSEDYSKEWRGTVIRKAEFVDPTTQSVSVFISVDPTRNQPLYEGQYLRAEFMGGSVANSMELPRKAVFNANQVFIVKDGKLAKRNINIIKTGSKTVIFDGLEKGVLVVAEPLANAREGTLVSAN